jgi:hypothetical protein
VTNTTPDIEKHIGLTVYNLGKCPGVYVWNGSEWTKLGELCVPPSSPTGTDRAFCAPSGQVTLTATVGAGETVDWYSVETGGTPVSGGEGTTTFTPALSGTTSYWAEARNPATGLTSATRTKVTATMIENAGAAATSESTVVFITGMNEENPSDADAKATGQFVSALPTLSVAPADNRTYQWQRKRYGDSDDKYVPIEGATGFEYTPALPAKGVNSYNELGLYLYRCVVIASVSGCNCESNSDPVEVAWGCGFKTASTWLSFMCHNLGANETLYPFDPAAGLHGAKYKFGAKNPTLTMSVDQSIPGAIDDWTDETIYPYQASGDWDMGTLNNPCPAGFRVPSAGELIAMGWNSYAPCAQTPDYTYTDATNPYISGRYYGDYFFLPAAGTRDATRGYIYRRQGDAWYWSSAVDGQTGIEGPTADRVELGWLFHYSAMCRNVFTWMNSQTAMSIRCIKE